VSSNIGRDGQRLTGRWGQPFLEHTFLYHLSRKDHRHNFSAYFYPIYLTLFPPGPTDALARSSPFVKDVHRLIRNPLSSFVPQFSLVALAGWLLARTAGIEMAVFVQTAIFVIFNKVCTSQVGRGATVLWTSLAWADHMRCH
jgi:phosphatidylinositol glycan class M